jgi:hypothetical protein
MKNIEVVFDRLSVDWTPEEDEAFNEVERQSNLGKQILQEINDDWRKNASEYERGFIDGMQKQMQSSVDKAVNAMGKREWVDLDIEEVDLLCEKYKDQRRKLYVEIRNLLKEKNT